MASSFKYAKIPAHVNFNHLLQDWDGFGINYVETAQTYDYTADPQDYGGFRTLDETQRQEILDMVFGENGLKPGVFKMFIDCFQQDENHLNAADPASLDMSNYDHETTTSWMRYFIKKGFEITRKRGGDLCGIATLYGPPAFMTKTRKIRGRDLDSAYETELAKYIVSFAKYMKDVEGLPIRYLSVHNEGEDFSRWPDDGLDSNIGTGHDYNLYWTPEHVAAFMPLLRKVAEATGTDFLPTPGECTGWTRFSHWGYANALIENPEALRALGLITSHGFYGDGLYEKWSNSHTDTGIYTIQKERPDLHAWVTSTSWKKMDSRFIFELHRSIYDAKVNAIIPWAAIQLANGWVGGDPNPGCAFSVKGDGTYTVEKGYYYYKQISRIGQPGMKVAASSCACTPCAIVAFSANGTDNPNAFAVINASDETETLDIAIVGGSAGYQVYRTSAEERYVDLGLISAKNDHVLLTCPPDSVTTLIAQ